MATLTTLTRKDLEKLQAQNPDYPMELVEGNIIVMSPSGYESDEVALELAAQLRNWVRPRKLGRVTGSSAGFDLPNSNVRAPDVSFVLAERLRKSPGSFAQLAPDLMVEVKSPTDSLKALRDKIKDFLAQGTKVGILTHPEKHTVEIYRPNQEAVILGDGDVLSIPDLLPGFEVAVADLWSPEF
ncbi:MULTISPECIES: Uma2 family endonuclease [unclassified Coleofasciculus]|uniref:Uma2 family endonuclease n=1 Tax=unclassified Coleofasciculus TaxID=2692782 RepID=UPI001880B648|nr:MULTISPECIES: Uma2 family endonuclease [unclassified Coleofasciculus]MBE9124907.1 Uma2 family endonuclease [Coleofasciculus sp. LEGE 07081]MBE9147848.1 Uma2 family endonuclease [Coleofasciculus sp. LEGE 07092]